MNVKITYAVPFERVPTKVDSLLDDASADLRDISEELTIGNCEADTVKKIKKIDELRKKLASIDFLLEDCYTILVGYNKAVTNMLSSNEATERPNAESQIQQGRSGSSSTEGSDI